MRHITDFGISRTQLEEIINEWIIGTKAERNRAILKSRYIDGLTFEEIAEVFNMSDCQVKGIIYRGEEMIEKHIKTIQ